MTAMQVTAFRGKMKSLLLVASLNLLISTIFFIFQIGQTHPMAFYPLPAVFPFILLMRKAIKTEKSESPFTSLFKQTFTAIVWCWNATFFSYFALFPLFPALTPFHSLAASLPMMVIESRSSRNDYYGYFGFFAVRLGFDFPLVFSALVLKEVFDMRLMSPFASIINDDIVQGSLPCPSDVVTLKRKYNVSGVINMCAEYPGPQSKYKKYGIEQVSFIRRVRSAFYDRRVRSD